VRADDTDGPQHLVRHEALLYVGDYEYLDVAASFVQQGLDGGDAVVAAVTPDRIDLLRPALGDAAERVLFVDVTEIGRNPTRLLAAWRQVMEAYVAPGQRLRGIGQPAWPDRPPAELLEFHQHEALANIVRTAAPAWVLCPYDTSVFDPAVIEDVCRTHPVIVQGGRRRASRSYIGGEGARAMLTAPLPEPDRPVVEHEVEPTRLRELRSFVADHAARAGLASDRVDDLVLAVNELATNSVLHGGGRGTLRAWSDGDTVIHEVRDRGRIEEPLVGRRRPARGQAAGRGLWVVNELCDLVQLRSSPAGTVVRLHMYRR
jgi:anti-sigma regulatory factor (Ser/Thr protein kinase)